MKYISTLFAAFVICSSAIAQQVGSKVSLVATDGKYTQVLLQRCREINIKYDGFEFELWNLLEAGDYNLIVKQKIP